MEITIDLFKVGYVLGRVTGKILKYGGAAQLACSGYRKLSRIAAVHKIDSMNVTVVSKNLFDCLPFID